MKEFVLDIQGSHRILGKVGRQKGVTGGRGAEGVVGVSRGGARGVRGCSGFRNRFVLFFCKYIPVVSLDTGAGAGVPAGGQAQRAGRGVRGRVLRGGLLPEERHRRRRHPQDRRG